MSKAQGEITGGKASTQCVDLFAHLLEIWHCDISFVICPPAIISPGWLADGFLVMN